MLSNGTRLFAMSTIDLRRDDEALSVEILGQMS